MVMFNLFDILQNQSGAGMQALGQQFGLSPEQSFRAMEALLPALTIGLQRNAASDPTGFGRLFGLVGAETRPGEPYHMPAEPERLLGQLFGSPFVSQAVLQQAAAASGIGAHALRQMLPIMAGMIVAGIVHVLLNQPAAFAPPQRAPEPQPLAPFPVASFWNEWIDGFLSSAKADAPNPKAVKDVSPEPKALPPAVSRPAEPEAKEAKKGEGADVPLEVFQQMFQTGVEVQEQNVKAMQDIFDSFWGSPEPKADNAAAPDAGKKPARGRKLTRPAAPVRSSPRARKPAGKGPRPRTRTK